ncbi:MAG: GAF domain-containing protein [Nitrospirae bacterium]|jgi:PAS domain S-box-containing protein|nr:GAF domain-containing protein [Nitrospirota bacterium]
MKSKTKKELIHELMEMRQRIAKLETLYISHEEIEQNLKREKAVNSAISELASKLLSPSSIEDISSLVLESVKHLTGSRLGYAGYIDPKTGYLISPTLTRDIWEACEVKDKNIIFKEFRGLWGWVLRNRKPLFTNTLQDDPRSSGTPSGHLRIHRFLSVPALIGENLVGQVALANSDRDYNERDLEIVERLVSLFAIAIHRKQSEETLHLLRKAVETIPIGLTITDTEGKIVYSNSADAKIHGYDVEELMGKNTRIFAPPEKWKPSSFEELRGLKIWGRESLNIKKKGEVFPVYLISVPVTDADGKPAGIITTCEDITDRKLAEETLIQRQKALHSVYKMATTLCRSFKEICNEVALSLSKLLKASHGIVLRLEDNKIKVISGISDGKLDAEEITCPEKFWDVPAYNKTEVFQLKGSLRDVFQGHPYTQYDLKSLISIPIIDTSGEAVGALVIMDQKEREFTEDEIHLIKIFARYIAFEIEREAMEIKLLNAQKMEVIGKLAGGVAHEVRNPLNAIMVFMETLIRDLESNAKYKPLIFHIRSEVNRLSDLMKDLLNLGRPVEKSDLRSELLNAICLASVDLWKHSEPGRSYTVKVLQPQDYDDVFVIADSQRLQQVFYNLLDNAARHSPEGSEIQLVIKRPEGNICRVQIIDRGKGLSEAILPRVFEPFFTTRRGGTGLGLSIVKHIVETHGGTVEIFNNEPPPGCTSEVRVPISNKQEL